MRPSILSNLQSGYNHLLVVTLWRTKCMRAEIKVRTTLVVFWLMTVNHRAMPRTHKSPNSLLFSYFKNNWSSLPAAHCDYDKLLLVTNDAMTILEWMVANSPLDWSSYRWLTRVQSELVELWITMVVDRTCSLCHFTMTCLDCWIRVVYLTHCLTVIIEK